MTAVTKVDDMPAVARIAAVTTVARIADVTTVARIAAVTTVTKVDDVAAAVVAGASSPIAVLLYCWADGCGGRLRLLAPAALCSVAARRLALLPAWADLMRKEGLAFSSQGTFGLRTE